jgi:hypothetical protein
MRTHFIISLRVDDGYNGHKMWIHIVREGHKYLAVNPMGWHGIRVKEIVARFAQHLRNTREET